MALGTLTFIVSVVEDNKNKTAILALHLISTNLEQEAQTGGRMDLIIR